MESATRATLRSCGGVATVGGVAVLGEALLVMVFGAGVEFEASLTNEAARTPSDSVATIARATIGAFRLEVGAKRVRAGAPQRRHQSCSSASGAPHSGQPSPEAAGVVAGEAGATVTRLQLRSDCESCLRAY